MVFKKIGYMHMKKWLLFAWMLLPLCLTAQDFQAVKTLTGHAGSVQNLRFSPDGRLLATGGWDSQVIVWNVASGKAVWQKIAHIAQVHEVSFSTDGKLLATAGGDGFVRVFKAGTGELVHSFLMRSRKMLDGSTVQAVSFVAFGPDNSYVFFGGANGYLMRGKVGKDPLTKGDYAAELFYDCRNEYITGGCISPDNRAVVLSAGKKVIIISLNTGSLIREFLYPMESLNDVIAGPGPNEVTTWSYDGKVQIWNYLNGTITKSLQVVERPDYSGATFSADGSLLATGAEGTIAKIWDWKAGKQIAKLSGHTKIIRICRFSPTEEMVATASYDKTIKLWKRVKTEKPDTPVPINPTPAVITAPEPAVTKIDVPPPPKLRTIKPEILKKDVVLPLDKVSFEQTRYELLEGSQVQLDELVYVMKYEVPTLIIEISGHTDNVGSPMANVTLSERRAKAVRNYLLEQGIAEERVEWKGYGGSNPIASNKTEEGRKKNRRVEFKVLNR